MHSGKTRRRVAQVGALPRFASERLVEFSDTFGHDAAAHPLAAPNLLVRRSGIDEAGGLGLGAACRTLFIVDTLVAGFAESLSQLRLVNDPAGSDVVGGYLASL